MVIKQKIKVMLIVGLLYLSSIVILNSNAIAKAIPEAVEDLDYRYIRNFTADLSRIILDENVYPPGTIPKGRFFGSVGEQHAAKEILQDEMIDIGLYNPSLDPPFLDKLTNLDFKYFRFKAVPPRLDLTTKLEILAKGLTVINLTNQSNPVEEEIIDCYISPFWNNSTLNLFYDMDKLTYNFTFENLTIDNVPTENCYYTPCNNTWFNGFLNNATVLELILSNDSSYDLPILWNSTMPLFEDYYNFSFENIDLNDNSTWPSGYVRYDNNETEDYVLIQEHSLFNPFSDVDAWKPPKKIPISLIPIIVVLREKYSWVLWHKMNPHCKGMIRFDTDPKAYDMNFDTTPIPKIYINGTKGKPIFNDRNNYTISYYINQSYNENVISYNVIGQINGTDTSKTVIVSCLLDSLWCQGTADSAIGMGIVMAIAKYFKDHDITPKYNIKFIGFCGEEYGIRGAKYYEAAHKDEEIIYVIDLNQLGFTQKQPELHLDILSNNLGFLNEIWEIAKQSSYKKRTGNAGLRKYWMPFGGPSDDQPFACNRPGCKTVCFLKGLNWVLHHRDGLNHTEGDVLKYFNWTDVNVTGEIILNVTKHVTLSKQGSQTPLKTSIITDLITDINRKFQKGLQ